MVSYDNSQPGRVGNWMQTFTGKAFYPLDPRPEEIDIRDIAHSLAHQCRYGGHALRYYSVAEHSLLVSTVLPPYLALAGLLHDASEAYLVDIPRPVKYAPQLSTGYLGIEDRLMQAIAAKYAFGWPLAPEVKDADNRILLDEREAVMAAAPMDWALGDLEPLGVKIWGLSPQAAEAAFLVRFAELTGGRL